MSIPSPTHVQDTFRASGHGLALEQWIGLTPLKRFALIKLTRRGHDTTARFIQALREFGL